MLISRPLLAVLIGVVTGGACGVFLVDSPCAEDDDCPGARLCNEWGSCGPPAVSSADGGSLSADAGADDAGGGEGDAGAAEDAGGEGGPADAGPADAGPADAGSGDGGPADAGPPGPGDICDDEATCGGGLVCQGGFCCAGPCTGECSTCTPTGTCEAATGAVCGEELSCGEYVYGVVEGACHAYEAVQVRGRCQADGSCEAPSPSSCQQQQVAPASGPIVECSAGCREQDHPCAPNVPRGQITLSAFCLTNEEACIEPFCAIESIDYAKSGFCNASGECEIVSEGCYPYRCSSSTAECFTSCDGDSGQCAFGAVCESVEEDDEGGQCL